MDLRLEISSNRQKQGFPKMVYPLRTDRATLTLVSGKHDDGALSRIAVTRHVVDTTVFLVKPLLLGEARLCESWAITHM